MEVQSTHSVYVLLYELIAQHDSLQSGNLQVLFTTLTDMYVYAAHAAPNLHQGSMLLLVHYNFCMTKIILLYLKITPVVK
jgi:hypothetical protein